MTTLLGPGLDIDLDPLVNLNLGGGSSATTASGSSTSDGSVLSTSLNLGLSSSPIVDLGVGVGAGTSSGTGDASSSGGLLDGLYGGSTAGGGSGLSVGNTVDSLAHTITDLSNTLFGTGSSGTGTGTGGGGTTGGTGAPQYTGTPGLTVTGTDNADVLHGSSGNDTISAGGGNDVIFGHGGNDVVDGGAGLDTFVATAPMAQYNAAAENGVLALQNKVTGETDYLMNVERIAFTDNKVLALDFNGDAGQAFRLYQAALNRTPDAPGLVAQTTFLDQGATLHTEAQNFINSAEFGQKYGQNLTDQQFVTALYNNTLHRAPDAAGFAGWNAQLASGASDRATVLIGFSESAENHQQTDHQLKNGILLDYGAHA